MLNNFILALSVVFPLLFIMSIGYILKRTGITDTHSLNIMNKMTFQLFLPVLLFLNIYSMRLEDTLKQANAFLIIMTALCIILSVVINQFLFSRFVKDKKRCSVMVQGTFRGNLLMFGIPIAVTLNGPDRIGTVSLLAASIVPLFNLLAVIILEMQRSNKIKIKKILLGIVTNPIIIASALAIILLLADVKIPKLIFSPLDSISKVATPLAFIVLGGTFQFEHLKHNMRYLLPVVVVKLILLPAFILSIAYLFGFRGEAIVALIGGIASPVAVSSYTMATVMEADGELAGQIVIVTSLISIISIFLWVLTLVTLKII